MNSTFHICQIRHPDGRVVAWTVSSLEDLIAAAEHELGDSRQPFWEATSFTDGLKMHDGLDDMRASGGGWAELAEHEAGYVVCHWEDEPDRGGTWFGELPERPVAEIVADCAAAIGHDCQSCEVISHEAARLGEIDLISDGRIQSALAALAIEEEGGRSHFVSSVTLPGGRDEWGEHPDGRIELGVQPWAAANRSAMTLTFADIAVDDDGYAGEAADIDDPEIGDEIDAAIRAEADRSPHGWDDLRQWAEARR